MERRKKYKRLSDLLITIAVITGLVGVMLSIRGFIEVVKDDNGTFLLFGIIAFFITYVCASIAVAFQKNLKKTKEKT